MSYSNLSPGQIAKKVYDETKERIKVDAEINTTLSGDVSVDISHTDDSVRLGDGTNLTKVNPDGSLYVAGGLVKKQFDYISASHNTTTSTYVYKNGGSSGTVVATVSIVYTDSTKTEIQSLAVS